MMDTTSTTSSNTTTTNSSKSKTQSATAAAGSSILNSLGAGSGIDTTTLVSNLVTATFANKESQIQAKQDANTAKISALATLSNGIDSFANALQQLVSGGTLKPQPSTSDSSVVTATLQAGASAGSFSGQIDVRQLATAKTVVSTAQAGGATSAVGLGGLTLTTGSGDTTRSFNITIDAGNNSLTGLAAAINATNTGTTPSGISASVITDSSGSRLVVKGTPGSANTFKLTANGADPDLSKFDTESADTGMAVAQPAQDAIVRIDGIDTTHSTNTITDLFPGVTLNLLNAKPGTAISLSVTRPTEAITQAVNDFVTAYNSLKGEIDSATAVGTGDSDAGALHGVTGIKQMKSMLQHITSTALTTYPNAPQTLAEIGVSTSRDGTLSVDGKALSKALATYPNAVEAMFNPQQHSDNPLVKITSAIGATKPGTYTLTDISAGPPPKAKVDGVDFLPSPNDPNVLVASITSTAPGLAIQPLGTVATATITIDPGLAGVLQSIRDQLRLNKSDTEKGALTTISDTLTAQTKTLSDQRDKLNVQESSYSDQLTKQFTAMQTAVNSYKSVQSFLTQQIAAWSKN